MLDMVLNVDEEKSLRFLTLELLLLIVLVNLKTDDEYRAPMHFILIDFRLEGVQMRVSIFAEENQVFRYLLEINTTEVSKSSKIIL